MSTLVVKFGGTSVADPVRIEAAALKVAAEIKRGHKVSVVVSAMAGVTNSLIESVRSISQDYDRAEYDVVVASGEQVTAGLMAIALQKLGVQARSFAGWQVPIKSDSAHGKARILEIDGSFLKTQMDQGVVPVIAGFQGIANDNRISTLGRGGSDTSAVALAAALKADRCDIYTDVDGVYTTDPRIVPQAKKIHKISYEEMLELASLGAKVLQTRSVELAMKWNVPVQVLSSFDEQIGSDLPGTLLMKEGDIMEQEVVNGVAYSRDEAKITLLNVPDQPGLAAAIFGPLAQGHVNVDMIVQNVSPDGKSTDMTFTLPRADVKSALDIIASQPKLKGIEIRSAADVSKISVVGIGMKSHSGVAATMFKALSEKGINIQVITTSEIKVSVLVAEEYTELAVRALHSVYDLEKRG